LITLLLLGNPDRHQKKKKRSICEIGNQWLKQGVVYAQCKGEKKKMSPTKLKKNRVEKKPYLGLKPVHLKQGESSF